MNNPTITMNVSQVGNLKFTATTMGGLEIIVEPGPVLGGSGKTPNPMEYYLASLGSCAAIKTQIELKKKGLIPESIAMKMECMRQPAPPDILEKIHLIFTLIGTLDEQKVKTAIHEVMTIFCPVALMADKSADITWEYHIRGFRLGENKKKEFP